MSKHEGHWERDEPDPAPGSAFVDCYLRPTPGQYGFIWMGDAGDTSPARKEWAFDFRGDMAYVNLHGYAIVPEAEWNARDRWYPPSWPGHVHRWWLRCHRAFRRYLATRTPTEPEANRPC